MSMITMKECLFSIPQMYYQEIGNLMQNPVKIDKTSTRNAGNIYFENNEMIRLTQNCDPNVCFSTKKNENI